jgi:hypothetical protein
MLSSKKLAISGTAALVAIGMAGTVLLPFPDKLWYAALSALLVIWPLEGRDAWH